MGETRRKVDQDSKEGAVRLVRETGSRSRRWPATSGWPGCCRTQALGAVTLLVMLAMAAVSQVRCRNRLQRHSEQSLPER